MNKKLGLLFVAPTLISSITSCQKNFKGKIYFELNGGHFSDPNFSTEYLEGNSNSPIKIEIPNPVKDGYYFVGWREKTKDGKYTQIHKRLASDGNAYYFYPYGETTIYAYFEPLTRISFDYTEYASKNVSLVAPIQGASDFSDGYLNGYVSKRIPSTDYLPTATGDHLTFEYWYTKYPLISIVDELGNNYYQLDKNAEEGKYQFDKQFGLDNITFPRVGEGEDSFVLYANFTEDPVVTLHFNIDGIEDYSFQVKYEPIKDKILEAAYDRLGIEMMNDAVYYPNDTKDKRFSGLYLDPEFKNQFLITSSVENQDLDLYFKWDNRVQLTFDYGDGQVDGRHSDVVDIYYQGDYVSEEVYEQHIPTKEYATFTGYTMDGKSYLPQKDILTGDTTLIATYDDYPVLTLSYDYPNGYTGERLEDVIYHVNKGDYIKDYLDSFASNLSDDDIFYTDYYFLDFSNPVLFNYDYMPEEDITVYLKLLYKTVVNLHTYTSSGTPLSGVDTQSKKYTTWDKFIEEDDFENLREDITVGTDVYCYDGIYFDGDLTEQFTLPLGVVCSRDEITTLNLYRKVVKGIKLTFLAEDKSELNLSLYVKPGSTIDEYQNKLTDLLGEYSQLLILNDDDSTTPLDSFMPTADAKVIVVR